MSRYPDFRNQLQIIRDGLEEALSRVEAVEDRMEAVRAATEAGSPVPLMEPLGDSGHHTDVPLTPEDLKLGDLLAYDMGTMYSDVDERWFHHERTSVNEWARVARALRIHGLKIVNIPDRVE